MQPTSISVPIPTDTFLALYEFLKAEASPLDPVQAVALAVDYWLDNADWKPELAERAPAPKSYRWKEVSLPHGTEVRMKYRGAYHYALINGDQFLFNDHPSSPSRFAHAVTQTARNAWRDLEVKRPHDRRWLPASSLRGSRQ